MSGQALHKLTISALVILLHLPLIYHATSLYAQLGPGQGIADLPAASLLLLFALLVLPYAVLAVSGIHWNPERARLNEYDA